MAENETQQARLSLSYIYHLMKLTTIGFASVVLAVSSFCPVVMANQTGVLNLDQVSPYNFDVGGEFTAYVTSGPQFVQNYSPLATTAGGFDTFCVEVDVDFNPGSSFNFSLNPTQSSDGYALSEGAAYLYSEFATGNLPDYNYADPSALDSKFGYTDDAELQEALWWFQGNQHYDDGAFPVGTNNFYYQLALNNLGLNASTAESPNNGDYNVQVLVLSTLNGDSAQNQLVYLGVPDQGGASWLLILGSLGLLAFAHAVSRSVAAKPALQLSRTSPSRRRP
jgi:hypothetical protein